MNERIKDKIEEIEKFLQELNEIVPNNFEDYNGDLIKKAACERYAEKIIEALTDLCLSKTMGQKPMACYNMPFYEWFLSMIQILRANYMCIPLVIDEWNLDILIIKEKNLKIPKEDSESFAILNEKAIISDELAKKLKDAKGMQNFLAHEYGKIDDEIIFNAVSGELERDAKDFIEQIKKEGYHDS